MYLIANSLKVADCAASLALVLLSVGASRKEDDEKDKQQQRDPWSW